MESGSQDTDDVKEEMGKIERGRLIGKGKERSIYKERKEKQVAPRIFEKSLRNPLFYNCLK